MSVSELAAGVALFGLCLLLIVVIAAIADGRSSR